MLVTGGSGVIGSALLPRLAGGPLRPEVIALVHRRDIHAARRAVAPGQRRRPAVGPAAGEYEALARRVDLVVHAAAVVSFKQVRGPCRHQCRWHAGDPAIRGARADAPLVHVSTAYLHPQDNSENPRTSVRYAASKRAAEQVVRQATVPTSIVRPSIVIGRSDTGETSEFQGFYRVLSALRRGMLPMLPFGRHWPLDLIPCDVVADGIATVLERESFRPRFLADRRIAGPDRRPRRSTLLCDTLGRMASRSTSPRFVAPDTYHRLIAPVFLDALPRTMRMAVSSADGPVPGLRLHGGAVPQFAGRVGRGGCRPRRRTSAASVRHSLDFWHRETADAAAVEAVA